VAVIAAVISITSAATVTGAITITITSNDATTSP
jgi:hypothetical protein